MKDTNGHFILPKLEASAWQCRYLCKYTCISIRLAEVFSTVQNRIAKVMGSVAKNFRKQNVVVQER